MNAQAPTHIPVCALALSASVPARSQVTLDISKITCWQFVTYKVTNPEYLAVWLNGYHHGKRGDSVLDTQQLRANADRLVAYCVKNPDALMMQAAAETVLEPQN